MVATRSTASSQRPKCLVTGGAGFLGKHLVEALLASGKYDVVVFDIRGAADPRVQSVVGDLRKPHDLEHALAGVDLVFHCATAAPSSMNAKNRELMHAVNVQGTANLLNACVQKGVSRLVYTSSASVVYEGRDLMHVDETHPLASRPMDYYTETKVLGEVAVLKANGKGGLATVALRPSGIFGPGDPLMLPAAIDSARKGKLKVFIGSGKNVFDWTYVGNVAQGHLQAAEALFLSSRLAGQAYFITNDEPRPFWGHIFALLQGLGYKTPTIGLPWLLAIILATIFEVLIMPIMRAFGKQPSTQFTRSRVTLMCCNRSFSCEKAKHDFGYMPQVSLDEAISRTIAAFSHERADATT